jgi:hypothetical protein
VSDPEEVWAQYEAAAEVTATKWLRGLDKNDADYLRTRTLYTAAMLLIVGRDFEGGCVGFPIYYALLRRAFERVPGGENLSFDKAGVLMPGEKNVLVAVAHLLGERSIWHAFERDFGPRKRNKRRRRVYGDLRIRLDDPHYVTAWYVEQLRRHWCGWQGMRRSSPGELKDMVERVIDLTREGFGVELSEVKLATVLREPKKRRLTKIFYED